MAETPPITVLGAGGWIGAALVSNLKRQQHQVRPIDRSSLPQWLVSDEVQGPVIYAIGLTADFRDFPYETVEAHVSVLSRVLQRTGIDQLLFISSARVYGRSAVTSETALLPCLSSDPSDLYNLSKLLGESLVLQDPRPGFKVVRLSNVVGPGQPYSTFLGALLKEASATGAVTIQQHADHSKDYVALSDVVRLLPQIAVQGRQRLYNLGSGRNTTHAEVAAWFRSAGVPVQFAANASCDFSFPPLVIDRLLSEFQPPGNPYKQTLLEQCLSDEP